MIQLIGSCVLESGNNRHTQDLQKKVTVIDLPHLRRSVESPEAREASPVGNRRMREREREVYYKDDIVDIQVYCDTQLEAPKNLSIFAYVIRLCICHPSLHIKSL